MPDPNSAGYTHPQFQLAAPLQCLQPVLIRSLFGDGETNATKHTSTMWEAFPLTPFTSVIDILDTVGKKHHSDCS